MVVRALLHRDLETLQLHVGPEMIERLTGIFKHETERVRQGASTPRGSTRQHGTHNEGPGEQAQLSGRAGSSGEEAAWLAGGRPVRLGARAQRSLCLSQRSSGTNITPCASLRIRLGRGAGAHATKRIGRLPHSTTIVRGCVRRLLAPAPPPPHLPAGRV